MASAMYEPSRHGVLPDDRCVLSGCALRPGGVHRPGAFDKLPFAPSAGDAAEQRTPDCVKIGATPADDEDRQAQRFVQAVDIHDVEAGKRDALQHDQLKMDAAELAAARIVAGADAALQELGG